MGGMVRNGCSKTLSLLTLSVLWAAPFGSACQSGQDHSRIVVRQGECLVCHQGDLDQVTSPPHEQLSSSTCGTCHVQVLVASVFHACLAADRRTRDDRLCVLSSRRSLFTLARPPFASAAIRMITTTAPSPGHANSRRPARTATRRSHGRLRRVATMPGERVPDQNGPHSPYRDDCVSCHNPDLGSPVDGENADCVGCHDGEHTRALMDPKHREENDYPTGAAPPNFCLDCHADGRNNDQASPYFVTISIPMS